MSEQKIKVGTILKATHRCRINGQMGAETLTIGKEYTVDKSDALFGGFDFYIYNDWGVPHRFTSDNYQEYFEIVSTPIEKEDEQEVYMDCNIRMSKEQMSSVLYAMIMTRAQITNSYGVGIYQYNRKQNGYNTVDLKIHIDRDQIDKFEELSGVKLKKPISITINNQ